MSFLFYVIAWIKNTRLDNKATDYGVLHVYFEFKLDYEGANEP